MAPLPAAINNLAASVRDAITHFPRESIQSIQHIPQRLPQLHSRAALDSLHDLLPDSPLASSTTPHKRQYTTVAIPQTYQGVRPGSGSPGPGAGTVVGIVLGSVAGFVLLVWLLWTLANFQNRESNVISESVEVVRERPLSAAPRSRRSHRSRRETVIMRERSRSRSRSRSPTVRGVSERIVMEERRASRAPSVIVPERRETIVVEERRERRVEGDDIVEVMEEGSISDRSPAPRRKDRRRRSSAGGYRSVDPNLFGGGDYPQHRVHRDRSLSSRS